MTLATSIESKAVESQAVTPHQWPSSISLETELTCPEFSSLMHGDEMWGSLRAAWAWAIRNKRPIRDNAARMGLELPDEPTPDDWRHIVSPECFVCWHRYDMQVHHIERRGQVHHAREDWLVNLMLVCGSCHADKLATMPHAKQLAYKWIRDPAGHASLETFLDRWLRIKDPELKAPHRVTAAEVAVWLLELRGWVYRPTGFVSVP